MDARDPPVQTFRRVPAVLGRGRVLPDLVLDSVLEHSPRRARAPPVGTRQIADLGFTHLQFEALLTAARESANPCDFALVAMLGLLGLRISKRLSWSSSRRAASRSPDHRRGVRLTAREQEITLALAQGLSTIDVAGELFLSAHTVRDHIKSIFAKLVVSSRGELVAKIFADYYEPALHPLDPHMDTN